jgi:hypothetical protein
MALGAEEGRRGSASPLTALREVRDTRVRGRVSGLSFARHQSAEALAQLQAPSQDPKKRQAGHCRVSDRTMVRTRATDDAFQDVGTDTELTRR